MKHLPNGPIHGASNDDVLGWVGKLGPQNFWGAVTLTFQNGSIVHVKQESTFKPNELLNSRNDRRPNDPASRE